MMGNPLLFSVHSYPHTHTQVINPNSGDTGGILADDWVTLNVDKLTILHDLQPAPSKLLPTHTHTHTQGAEGTFSYQLAVPTKSKLLEGAAGGGGGASTAAAPKKSKWWSFGRKK
jgi:hypothetical protein